MGGGDVTRRAFPRFLATKAMADSLGTEPNINLDVNRHIDRSGARCKHCAVPTALSVRERKNVSRLTHLTVHLSAGEQPQL
jgi:hypothetical protein